MFRATTRGPSSGSEHRGVIPCRTNSSLFYQSWFPPSSALCHGQLRVRRRNRAPIGHGFRKWTSNVREIRLSSWRSKENTSWKPATTGTNRRSAIISVGIKTENNGETLVTTVKVNAMAAGGISTPGESSKGSVGTGQEKKYGPGRSHERTKEDNPLRPLNRPES